MSAAEGSRAKAPAIKKIKNPRHKTPVPKARVTLMEMTKRRREHLRAEKQALDEAKALKSAKAARAKALKAAQRQLARPKSGNKKHPDGIYYQFDDGTVIKNNATVWHPRFGFQGGVYATPEIAFAILTADWRFSVGPR